MAYETTERMLRMMLMLSGNETLSRADMAKRLDVDERSIERYIKDFNDLGLETVKRGGYDVLDVESKVIRKLRQLTSFTKEEAKHMKMVIECLPESDTMKKHLKAKIDQMYELKVVVDQMVRRQNAENLPRLLQAIAEKKQVILYGYASANSNNVRNRLVEPIAFSENYVQINCYEPESDMNKMFKTERIERVEVLEHFYMFEKEHRMCCTDIFGIYKKERIRIQLKLNVRAAKLLQEEYPLSLAFLKTLDKNHWLLDTHVCSMEGAGRFVMGLMDDIEVIRPKKFVTFLKNKVKMAKSKLQENTKNAKNEVFQINKCKETA